VKIGDKTRHVISKSKRNRKFITTEEVVYKTYMGKSGGKPYFSSQTRHEKV